MLEAILIHTVFNTIPFFDPVAMDNQMDNQQKKKTMNQRLVTKQVQNLELDVSPPKLQVKTTSFFDNMWCASYAKEQVSTEVIEVVFDSSCEQPSIIQRSFAWTEDIDDEGSSGEKEVEYCTSINHEEDFDTESLVSLNQYQAKDPSGSVSTATTVTMNTYNTIESWETLRTSPASASYDSAMDQETLPESNLPPPKTIRVLSSKPKQRKGAPKLLPNLSSKKSMRPMPMRALRVSNYAY
jgi:hypothetical protein